MSEAAVRIGRQDIPRTFRRGWRSSFSTTPVYSCARSSPEEAEGKGRRGHRNSEGMTRLTSDPYRSVVGAAVDRKPRMNGSRVYVEEIVRDQLQRTSSDSSETYTIEFFFSFCSSETNRFHLASKRADIRLRDFNGYYSSSGVDFLLVLVDVFLVKSGRLIRR